VYNNCVRKVLLIGWLVFFSSARGIPPLNSSEDVNFFIEDLISSGWRETAATQFGEMTEAQKDLIRNQVIKLALQKIPGPYIDEREFLGLIDRLKIPMKMHESEFRSALKSPGLHDVAVVGLALTEKDTRALLNELHPKTDRGVIQTVVRSLPADTQNVSLLVGLVHDPKRPEALRAAAVSSLSASPSPDAKQASRGIAFDGSLPPNFRSDAIRNLEVTEVDESKLEAHSRRQEPFAVDQV
jgi:hypothetical protein